MVDSVVPLGLDLDLNISDPGPDSPFPRFACACNLAGSEDEPPGFVSVYISVVAGRDRRHLRSSHVT